MRQSWGQRLVTLVGAPDGFNEIRLQLGGNAVADIFDGHESRKGCGDSPVFDSMLLTNRLALGQRLGGFHFWSWRVGLLAEQNLVDAALVHVHDFELAPVPGELFTRFRDGAEEV